MHLWLPQVPEIPELAKLNSSQTRHIFSAPRWQLAAFAAPFETQRDREGELVGSNFSSVFISHLERAFYKKKKRKRIPLYILPLLHL